MKNSTWLETLLLHRMWQEVWVIFFHEQTYLQGTLSLQRMWQEVQIILFYEETHTGEKPHPCKEYDINLGNV